MTAMWRGYRGGITEAPEDVDTRVPRAMLETIAAGDDRAARRASRRTRRSCACSSSARRWAGASGRSTGAWRELLAYGSLLYQRRQRAPHRGRTARAARSATATRSSPTSRPAASTSSLGQLHPDQGQCRIYDSPLSEAGVHGLRVRLLARLPRRAGDVGGAVRRLRERRAGDHRSVHHVVGGQVEAPVGHRAAAAARLRGPGPGALERAPRALPADRAPSTTSRSRSRRRRRRCSTCCAVRCCAGCASR